MKSLYDLVWGQCSETMRSRPRSIHGYEKITSDADSISLLKAIRAEMAGFKEKQYLVHLIHNLIRDFYRLYQGHRSNQEYYDEFQNIARTIDERGGSIGEHIAIYQQIKTESVNTNPKTDEIKLMKHDAKNRYLAVAFTLNADKSRYGPMIEYIENEFLRRTSVSSKTGTFN